MVMSIIQVNAINTICKTMYNLVAVRKKKYDKANKKLALL